MTRREDPRQEKLYLDVPFPDKAGPLRPPFSRTLGHSAWSNGCVACSALLGGFPLCEDFAHWQSTGVALPVVASARIPLDVLYDEADPRTRLSTVAAAPRSLRFQPARCRPGPWPTG
jgi:hypothetical protein